MMNERSLAETAAPDTAARRTHRDRIVRAAAEEFSKRGFHGTSARRIAGKARVSLGNIYNHFPSLKDLFDAALEEEAARYASPDAPLAQAFASLRFPEDLERLASATHESVTRFARYLKLIYVDVIEFEGAHIGRLFNTMRKRYEQSFGKALDEKKKKGEIGDVDPVSALMASTLLFFNYFAVEELFGGENHFGGSHARAVEEMCRVLRNGVLPRK